MYARRESGTHSRRTNAVGKLCVDMPRYSDDLLNSIYDKTGGYCAYCGKKLAFVNYGIQGARANWEVDHDIPISRGGANEFKNLVAACFICNRSKGDLTGKEFMGGGGFWRLVERLARLGR